MLFDFSFQNFDFQYWKRVLLARRHQETLVVYRADIVLQYTFDHFAMASSNWRMKLLLARAPKCLLFSDGNAHLVGRLLNCHVGASNVPWVASRLSLPYVFIWSALRIGMPSSINLVNMFLSHHKPLCKVNSNPTTSFQSCRLCDSRTFRPFCP